MVIKMDTIDGAHAANAINYVLDKEKARKEDRRGACRQRYQLCARQGEGKEGGQASLPRR